MKTRLFAMLAGSLVLSGVRADVYYNQAWREAGADYVGYTVDVGVADFNGDGRDDVWLVNPNGPSRVWLQNSSGVLEDSGQALGAGATNGVAVGDLDGDGDIDVIEAVSNASNKIWLNDGAGQFTESALSVGSGSSFNVALGDLNGDNALDIFVANFSNTRSNSVWLNNAAGGGGTAFALVGGQPFGNTFSSDVALGDIDNDGDLDAVVANTGANTVWLNDGTGLFTAGTTPANNSAFSKAVVLADFDGDGNLDAFFGDANANHVWQGDGAGNFTDAGVAFNYSASSQGMVVRDFNGDGHPDVFVSNDFDFGEGKLWLFNGTAGTPASGANPAVAGTISFVDSGIVFGAQYGSSVALGDFDNDGSRDDLYIGTGATAAQPDRIWLQQSSSPLVFAAGQALQTGAPSNAVALGDIDADGDLDAFVANSGANSVLRNNGGLQFQTIQLIRNDISQGVVLVDVDQDNDLDAVVVNGSLLSGGGNRVWLNDGSGVFSFDEVTGTHLDNGSFQRSFGVAAGNLDGDACPDIAIANLGAPDEVWLNTDTDADPAVVNCVFANAAIDISGGANTLSRAVEIRDIDADGSADILITVEDGSVALINDGSGSAYTFQAVPHPAGATLRRIVLADLNGDASTPDAFGVSNGAGYFWASSGGGNFAAAVSTALVNNNTDVAIGDIDGVGGNDLFVVSDIGANKVLFNDGAAGFTDSGITLPTVSGLAVALGDLDGDADLDAFIAANGLNVALRHDPVDSTSRGMDINFDGFIDGSNDGIMILRYLVGLRDDAILMKNALPPGSGVTSGDAIRAYIQGLVDASALDANGDGFTDGSNDGIMILRYLVGLRDDAILLKNVSMDGATRTTGDAIRAWMVAAGL